MSDTNEIIKDYACPSCNVTMTPGAADHSEENDGCIVCFLDVACPDCEKKYTVTFRPSEIVEV